MLKKASATLALVIALLLAAPALAYADGWGGGGAECDGADCWVWGEGGGSGGGGSDNGGQNAISIGFTPGPNVCYSNRFEEEIDCSASHLGDNWWSNSRQCYLSLAIRKNQTDPRGPSGSSPEGAWYTCSPLTDINGSTGSGPIFWSNTPPPGITTYSPSQAARIVISRFQLRGIDIGRTPEGGDKTYIGLPVWLWADNPQPLNYGPYTETVTVGGQTITATATVSSISWDMGDGTRFTCGQGTPYNEAYGIAASPTCDHTYTRVGTYDITATSNWIVMWSGGGASGQISVQTPSSTTLEIGQLQSVNVANP